MKIQGKEAMLNKAAGEQPKSGHAKPAGKASGSNVGRTDKADMAGAFKGNDPLAGAIAELHAQHPIDYDDLGPHHGGNTHIRHEPLHGLKPRG